MSLIVEVDLLHMAITDLAALDLLNLIGTVVFHLQIATQAFWVMSSLIDISFFGLFHITLPSGMYLPDCMLPHPNQPQNIVCRLK